MTEKYELRKVQYMPTNLEPGILYVAEAFGAAAHLCACDCGTIVRTPLNRWTLQETQEGPSLDPSIGNWQERCQSHYWIERGKVRWAGKWTPQQITDGRRQEQDRLRAHYDAFARKRERMMLRLWSWMKNLFNR
jgi:hypothetical protein